MSRLFKSRLLIIDTVEDNGKKEIMIMIPPYKYFTLVPDVIMKKVISALLRSEGKLRRFIFKYIYKFLSSLKLKKKVKSSYAGKTLFFDCELTKILKAGKIIAQIHREDSFFNYQGTMQELLSIYFEQNKEEQN